MVLNYWSGAIIITIIVFSQFLMKFYIQQENFPYHNSVAVVYQLTEHWSIFTFLR